MIKRLLSDPTRFNPINQQLKIRRFYCQSDIPILLLILHELTNAIYPADARHCSTGEPGLDLSKGNPDMIKHNTTPRHDPSKEKPSNAFIRSSFYLDKWFLDFVSPQGEAMIFYAAKLKWRSLTVPYTSWLHYHPENGVTERSRFRRVCMPEKHEKWINWEDPGFDVAGSWEALGEPLESRIFQSEEGHLDWKCFQPASKVKLKINGKILIGSGYAEQLIMTIPPWRLPMQELRWGRFVSETDHLVWIEILDDDKKQWIWWNGQRMGNGLIDDDRILIPEIKAELQLKREVTLNSDKNIFSVVRQLHSYLPGFNKIIPTSFLMADNYKWLSRGQWLRPGRAGISGTAIHEWVNFNPR